LETRSGYDEFAVVLHRDGVGTFGAAVEVGDDLTAGAKA
jgi:hypothetical protein